MRRLLLVTTILAVTAATIAAPAAGRPIRKPRWLAHTIVTEYYAAPESWFVGEKVDAPGLSSPHRIDWLYSARGVSMEGDGIGLDGRQYHIEQLGSGGWVDERGRRTGVSGGNAFWRAGGYWKSAHHKLTFPLDAGGWLDDEVGVRYVQPPGATFAPGPSLPLVAYQSVAVDPGLIPMGSRVYIPAYRDVSGGWFKAQDTGGAIDGRHVDVYRTPPASPDDGGNYLRDQRIYVLPPGTTLPDGGGGTAGG